ncbi:MAG: CDP-alcohol phosphatidyltransferase family protein [Chromatiaceae bacterium]|nr:CDP-alcohol phosphatidyltransferase family protein [Chromatiaceae bacterium]MBP9603475.1 CDP-alcohol phosphatidyltransferase family protein [Chromatiaceae bacterium]
MTAPHPAQHPDRDLARSARANGLAGLALTLGLGLALVEVLGLGGYFIAKALAIYGLILLMLRGFLSLHRLRTRLGPANQVTLLRGVLTALLIALAGEGASGGQGAGLAWTAFALALIATALDGVDGWLARRHGWTSPLGARLDMEVDALLVAGLALLLWTLDRAGPWVLAAGAMRYLFVVAGFLWPWLRQPLPPSRRRQAICVAQVLTLTLALAPILPATWAGAVAAIGLGLLCYSFAVDIVWLARRPASLVAPAPQVRTPGAANGPSWTAWRPWLGLAAALWLLNAVLSFQGRWPTLWVEWRWELAPEIAFLVLALGGIAGIWGGRPSRSLIAGLAGLLTLLVLGRYLAVMAPALYGRPIDLIADARYLPEVIPMLAQAAPWHLLLGLPLALLLLLGLIFVGLRWALGRVVAALGAVAPRRVLTLLGGVAFAAYLMGLASPGLAWGPGFSRPVTLALAEQLRLAPQTSDAQASGAQARAGAPGPPPSPPLDSDLGRVRGAHVVILFAESYGAATFDQSRLAAALAPARADLAAALAETGRGVVSAWVRSPTFAGGSWLAHASLLAGVEVRGDEDYNRLLTQSRETLVQPFARAGYRTLGVMPGLRHAWPEGVFYGYDAILDAPALDYPGPALGWWRIPDQFALARLDAAELTAGDGQPRLAVFPTISSHAPFRPTAPYQPDWGRILTADPFDPAEIKQELTPAGGEEGVLSDLGPAYGDAVAYLLRVVAGWLRLRPDLDLVLLVLGDHQPLAAVSGEGASWEVPVHIITQRAEVRAAFLAEGFVPGLVPRRPALGGMADLTQALLRAFGSGPVGDIRAPSVNVSGALGQAGEGGPHSGGVQPAGPG